MSYSMSEWLIFCQLVDGWELQGELFPSPEEAEGGLDAQYKTFCGAAAPPTLFTSSQNVALVQFRVPRAGQGFRVRVRFLRNPEREWSGSVTAAMSLGITRLSTGGGRQVWQSQPDAGS